MDTGSHLIDTQTMRRFVSAHEATLNGPNHWAVALYFGLLWGAGLFVVFEAELFSVKAVVVAFVVLASLAIDKILLDGDSKL